MNDMLRHFMNELFDLPYDLKWVEEDLFGFVRLLEIELKRTVPVSTKDTHNPVASSVIINSVVAPNAFIGHFSIVRNSIVQEGARIGAHVEIAHSIVLSDAVIPHHNYIGWSIVGREVHLGGNTRTAVRRLDGRNPRIELPNIGLVTSAYPKVGAFIGDKSKIGSSVVLNPMTIIGKHSIVEPGLVLSGYYQQNSKIENQHIHFSDSRPRD